MTTGTRESGRRISLGWWFLKQCLKGTQHRLAVSTGPVDSPAVRTALEMSLSLKDVGRYPVTDLFARDFLQLLVAGEAAREDRGQARGADRAKDLADLFLNFLTLEKNKPLYGFTHKQAGISGQEDAPLATRERHQLIIRVTIGIENIEPGDPKPLGQTPKHDVGYEPGLRPAVFQYRAFGSDLVLPERGRLFS